MVGHWPILNRLTLKQVSLTTSTFYNKTLHQKIARIINSKASKSYNLNILQKPLNQKVARIINSKAGKSYNLNILQKKPTHQKIARVVNSKTSKSYNLNILQKPLNQKILYCS